MNTIKTDTGDALSAILSGREERVRARDRHLSEVLFACQITINIPGYPKRIENDCKAIEKYASLFSLKWGSDPICTETVSNEAGLCWIGFFRGWGSDTQRAKKVAVDLEECSTEGRILDIDIIVCGRSISRSDLGLPARSCILCGRTAKECAREMNHTYSDLRAAVKKLIENI